jgi:hypothetical protein
MARTRNSVAIALQARCNRVAIASVGVHVLAVCQFFFGDEGIGGVRGDVRLETSRA